MPANLLSSLCAALVASRRSTKVLARSFRLLVSSRTGEWGPLDHRHCPGFKNKLQTRGIFVIPPHQVGRLAVYETSTPLAFSAHVRLDCDSTLSRLLPPHPDLGHWFSTHTSYSAQMFTSLVRSVSEGPTPHDAKTPQVRREI